MPAPLATLTISINGGSPTTGAVACAGGETVQLSAISKIGWTSNPVAIWRLYAFPVSFTVPAGWTDDGNGNYFFSGNGDPPSFTLPSASSGWGKFLPSLVVSAPGGQLVTDIASGISIPSPALGLKDLAFREENQFSATRLWQGDLAANLRKIESLSSGAITPASITFPATDSTPTISQAPTSVNGATGTAMAVQAQTATGTASTGADLDLSSGAGVSGPGAVNLLCGNVAAVNVIPGQVTLCDAAGVLTCIATLASAGASGLTFGHSCTGITYGQSNNTTNGATAASTTVKAQTATGTTSTGGTLNASSGGGTTPGAVNIQVAGATKIKADATGIGLYGGATTAQPTRVGQLTDSTGGSATSTLASGITDVNAKNAIASLAAKVNALELALHNLGVTA